MADLVLFIVAAVVTVLLARRMTRRALRELIAALDQIVTAGERLDTLGPTGVLQRAVVFEVHDTLNETGGRLYRLAVPLAAFLLWWPIGPLFCEGRVRRAYARVGMTGEKQAGAGEAWYDMRRGFARDTHYYPISHLRGLVAALSVAEPER